MSDGALARVVPSGYKVCRFTAIGTVPLLMSSGESDPDSDLARAFRQLTQMRRKSEEQMARIRELEWYLRFYYDEEIGPYIPGRNIKEMIRAAATKFRLGEDVRRSLVIPAYRVPLMYDGPRDLPSLWDQGFRYTIKARNAGPGKTMVDRTRPRFDRWSISTLVAFDADDIDHSTLETIVKRTERYGLGDFRPEFGAFTSTFELTDEKRERARANGVKKIDAVEKRANDAFVGRIVVDYGDE